MFATVVTMEKKLLSRKSWCGYSDPGTHICRASEVFGHLHAAGKHPCLIHSKEGKAPYLMTMWTWLYKGSDPNAKLCANEKHSSSSRAV